MEKIKYSYHISLCFCFKNDVDVDSLEEKFGIKAYRKIFLKDSLGKNKTAKIWYKTAEITELYTTEVIEKYVESIFENFKDLKQILSEENGSGYLGLVFTSCKERPIIGLTLKTMELLAKLGLSFDVDFV